MVLEDLIQIIRDKDSDHTLSWWDNDEELIKEINSHIQRLVTRNFFQIKELRLLFAPTSGLQDLSIGSGWGKEFLVIAENFDKVIEELIERFC